MKIKKQIHISFCLKFLILSMLFYISSNDKLRAQSHNNFSLEEIKILAAQKQYKNAIDLILNTKDSIINSDEINSYLAHLYAWDGQYEESLIIINKQIEKGFKNNDLMKLYLNLYFWKGNNSELLRATNYIEMLGYIDQYDLFIKRLFAYQGLNDNEGVNQLIAQNKQFEDSIVVKKLIKQHLINSKTQSFGLGYTIDFFDEFSPQHLESFDFKTENKNYTLQLKANTAQRFGNNDFQIESDFYKRVYKKDYFYLNYGYGFLNEIFPNHRVSGEYYHVLKTKTEASLGFAYLIYKNDQAAIANVSVAQYFSKYRMGIKLYYLPFNNEKSYTIVAFARKYGYFKQNFLGLEISYGNSPIERINLIQDVADYNLLNAKIKIERSFLVGKSFELKMAAAYHYEEYYLDLFRNRYQLEAIIRYNL